MRTRVLTAAGLAVAAALVGLHALAWRSGARDMRVAVAEWVDAQRTAGLVVEHGSIRIEGYPAALTALVADPLIELPGTASWRAPGLAITVGLADPTALVFRPRGEQRVSWAPAGEDWTIALPHARARLEANGAGGFRLTLSAGAGRISDAGAAYVLDVQSGEAEIAAVGGSDGGAVELEAEALAARFSSPGGDLDAPQLSVKARYSPAASGGGDLAIDALRAKAQDGEAQLSGTLAIASDGGIDGSLDAALLNPGPAAAALAALAGATPEAAAAAGARLSLAAIAQGGVVKAPVEFRDGNVIIAGAVIGATPSMRAPDGR